jgi:CRP/FNR family cyclic AMP-dependent transcriptional regulator
MEKISVLRWIDIFRTIPDEQLADVASTLRDKEVFAGEEIIREGDMGTSMFIIVEGRVRVHRDDKEIATLGSGDLFGEMAALDAAPRSASVTALSDVFLFELDGSALYDIMSDRPEVVRGLIRILCNRVRTKLNN